MDKLVLTTCPQHLFPVRWYVRLLSSYGVGLCHLSALQASFAKGCSLSLELPFACFVVLKLTSTARLLSSAALQPMHAHVTPLHQRRSSRISRRRRRRRRRRKNMSDHVKAQLTLLGLYCSQERGMVQAYLQLPPRCILDAPAGFASKPALACGLLPLSGLPSLTTLLHHVHHFIL